MEDSSGAACLDGARWDADCEAAFEAALPPRWEFRDRAWGSPGVWRAFPEAVSAEINALARRGQRRGNVSQGGCEFIVDLQDMVAVPTDQSRVPRMLRKSVRQPHANKRALKQLYLKYVEEVPPADHPGGPDGITGEKFLQLFKDLDVDPAADVAALALAAACNASEMGVFRRREFICGCAVLEVDNLEDLRSKMPELREGVLSGKALPEVYAYTFGVALEAPSKVLPLEEAQQYWALLLHDWALREDFCSWAALHMKGKSINRDLWMMVLKLATEVPADLSTYDENPAWPVVFDEFVEYYRAQKGL
mmetsp:Transcript_46937/g.149874  ORF Transcript_46937/g.149874 Transcript_46937/m.149874 type:complete len:307 (-) Transcript_46937:172-1092(-)